MGGDKTEGGSKNPPSLYSISADDDEEETPIEKALREALSEAKAAEAAHAARMAVLMTEMERLNCVPHTVKTSEVA